MPCLCPDCTRLTVWPDIPAIDPPSMKEFWENPKAEWEVACDWLGPLIDGKAVLIRRNMMTDGGSIPRSAWVFVGHPFFMPHLPAFLQHDGEFGGELFSREICDLRLYETLRLCRSKKITAEVIYRCVRLFGIYCWRAHTDESVERYRSFARVVGEEEYRFLVETANLEDG